MVDVTVAHVHLAKALSLIGKTSDPLRASVLAALGNTYSGLHNLSPKERLLAAIECHRQAAFLFQAEGHLLDWAREEFNLGNNFSELTDEAVPDRWGEAIEHYKSALLVRTKETNPEAYAGTLQNLGIAYRERHTGDRSQNIKHSILCYRRALQVRRRRSHPREYGGLQINIANSYLSLAEMDKAYATRHISRAVRHYDRALASCARDDSSDRYAKLLFNRGEALVRLALESRNPQRFLEDAFIGFREAADRFSRLKDNALLQRSREWLQTISTFLSNSKA
jgi:tetratricopeptide (TPR) repeat protein